MDSATLDIRNLPILYLILGTIEKIQGRYLAGYRRATELKEKKKVITDYAYALYRKFTLEAI